MHAGHLCASGIAGLTSLPGVGATEGPKNRDRTVR